MARLLTVIFLVFLAGCGVFRKPDKECLRELEALRRHNAVLQLKVEEQRDVIQAQAKTIWDLLEESGALE